MFTIHNASPVGTRVTSDTTLTPEDFNAIVGQLDTHPFLARKSGLIAASACDTPTPVETRWNGRETTNLAQPGDFIATTLDKSGAPLTDAEGQRNRYVITKDKFASLYEPAGVHPSWGALYSARSAVTAVYLTGGFEIHAPWGEAQRADRGYLVLNGTDVYGNNADTFEASYERCGA